MMMIRQRSPVLQATAAILSLSMLAMGCRGLDSVATAVDKPSAIDDVADVDTCDYPEEIDVGDPDDDTCDVEEDTTAVKSFSLKTHNPWANDPPGGACNKALFDCLQGCNDRLGTGLTGCARNTWGIASRQLGIIGGLTVAVRMALAKSCTLANFKKVLTVAGIALLVIDALFVITDIIAYYDCCRPFRSAYAQCRVDCFAAAGVTPPATR
jgi:hypothetical protein